jgi:hypothetical protein
MQFCKLRPTAELFCVLTVAVPPRCHGCIRSVRQQCHATDLQNLRHGCSATIDRMREVIRQRNCSTNESGSTYDERVTHTNTHPSSNVYTLFLPVMERPDM